MKLFLIPKIDPRLNELDYGNWSGHTNQEVIEKYGEKVFKDWEERGVWPHDAEWGSSREDVIKELAAFVVDLIKDHEQDETILIVSSTGRIRHLLKLSNDVFDPKVKTGNVCELSYKNGELTITSWNIAPEKL
jgi:broad specificity phosphatase PhoE